MTPTFLSRNLIVLAAALVVASGAANAQDRVRTGTLDAQSPTFDRPKHLEAVSPTCALAGEDASADAVSYAAFDIEVTAPENLTAEIVDAGTSEAFDPMLVLYCAPFDPQAPLANLVATNDDRGPLEALPWFTADRAIALEPGSTYTIVVTTFNPGDFGDFELALTSPTAHFVPEPEGGGIAALLAIVAAAYARRRSRTRR
jgi:hypothetical protein